MASEQFGSRPVGGIFWLRTEHGERIAVRDSGPTDAVEVGTGRGWSLYQMTGGLQWYRADGERAWYDQVSVAD